MFKLLVYRRIYLGLAHVNTPCISSSLCFVIAIFGSGFSLVLVQCQKAMAVLEAAVEVVEVRGQIQTLTLLVLRLREEDPWSHIL